MRLIDTLRGQRAITTLEDYAQALNSFQYGGNTYYPGSYNMQQTLQGSPVEKTTNSFTGYATVTANNGVVFACMLARLQIFAQVRLAFQRLRNGEPAGLFSTPELDLLSQPYEGGTTQDLLSRFLQDADLSGNGYLYKDGRELLRLRPDWTYLFLERTDVGTYRKMAYGFDEDGTGKNIHVFMPWEVAHFAPNPDPLASYRGMSWLTPVLREMQTDNQMNDHKQKFLANAATPNLAITLDKDVAPETFERFREQFEAAHRGSANAGKTLFLGGGADVTLVGSDFRKMELNAVQSHGETRVCSAAGVPPIIVGVTEGLQSGTYSNYGQAVRSFGDRTMHTLWQNACGTLAPLINVPSDAELWFDPTKIPFLRQDATDAAAIAQTEAATIRQLIDAGYEPDSVITAVTTGDWSRLIHTGLFSVQLQPPGTQAPTSTQEAPA